MTTPGSAPDVSVVIEWDNVRLVNAPRGAKMLDELLKQLLELRRSCEVVLVHDPGELSSNELQRMIEDVGFRAADIPVRAAQASGEHYYELKNIGAELARAPIVIYVDSDVVPEPGWLRALIEPFERDDVDVVGGNTYAGPTTSAYRKAFALFWFFPLRADDAPPRPQRSCWANNCAFRREVLQTHRWPRMRFIRYQNVRFFQLLARSGVRVWSAPRARVEHPIPVGIHFFRYAFSEGHDAAVRIEAGSGLRRLLLGPAYALLMLPGRIFGYARLLAPADRRRAVGMAPGDVPIAVAVAAAYALAVWLGYLATVISPDIVPRRFSV